MQKKIFLLSLLLSLINITYSQTEESSEDKSFENEYYNAEAYIDDGNFQEAIEIYKKLLQVNSDNSNLNFKIGYCSKSICFHKEGRSLKSSTQKVYFAWRNRIKVMIKNYSIKNLICSKKCPFRIIRNISMSFFKY